MVDTNFFIKFALILNSDLYDSFSQIAGILIRFEI